jgi:hypothetical protein
MILQEHSTCRPVWRTAGQDTRDMHRSAQQRGHASHLRQLCLVARAPPHRSLQRSSPQSGCPGHSHSPAWRRSECAQSRRHGRRACRAAPARGRGTYGVCRKPVRGASRASRRPLEPPAARRPPRKPRKPLRYGHPPQFLTQYLGSRSRWQ